MSEANSHDSKSKKTSGSFKYITPSEQLTFEEDKGWELVFNL